MIFANVKSITIPEGNVVKITQSNLVLWQKPTEEETIVNLIDTIGYSDNTRLSTSSGSERTNSGNVTTGYIELGVGGDVYRTSGVDFRHETSGYNCLCFYNSSKTFTTQSTYFKYSDSPISIQGITIEIDMSGNLTMTLKDGFSRTGDYIRFTGYGSGINLIVTKNQEIPS
jgi:hypothetical protein